MHLLFIRLLYFCFFGFRLCAEQTCSRIRLLWAGILLLDGWWGKWTLFLFGRGRTRRLENRGARSSRAGYLGCCEQRFRRVGLWLSEEISFWRAAGETRSGWLRTKGRSGWLRTKGRRFRRSSAAKKTVLSGCCYRRTGGSWGCTAAEDPSSWRGTRAACGLGSIAFEEACLRGRWAPKETGALRACVWGCRLRWVPKGATTT